MSTVVIGCKLPHGIVIKSQAGKDIALNGMNTSLIAGGYGITHVDAGDAAAFFVTHADFAPVKNGAIFTHHSDSVDDIAAIANEYQSRRTGFEGLDPSTPVPGLKPADEQALDDSKLANKPAPKAVASKADKAATAKAASLAKGAE